jgi:HEAT repeat protein
MGPEQKMIRAGFVAAIVAVGSSSLRAQDAAQMHEELLLKYGIQPSAESIREYLQQLHPGIDAQRRIQALVEQLGDDDYFVRDRATRQLLRLPRGATEILRKALESDDPEVRWRADQVLKNTSTTTSQVLNAAFSVIEKRKIKGLTTDLLQTIPYCDSQTLKQSAYRALSATAQEADAPLLRENLKYEDPDLRIAAIEALVALLGEAAVSDIAPLRKDVDDQSALIAARHLLNFGDRSALNDLVRLLESPTLKVRLQAVRALRAASGKSFHFIAYEEDASRAEAINAWQNWVANQSAIAELAIPLSHRPVELERTLFCNYSENKIYELDESGKQIWEAAVGPHPWAIQGLTNGHRLVGAYSARTVTEYDATGELVWQTDRLPGGPMSVQRLENGNTLIACSDSEKVLEIDRTKKVAWEATISGRPTHAVRLENGNTLVCLQNGNSVVEVNQKGKTIWEIKNVVSPMSVQRLENGNTLVASIGRGAAIEYSRNGEEIDVIDGYRNPYYAQRLSNGNTLIADNGGIRERTPTGKDVWSKAMSSISKAHRF